jgi:steroid delta-isomerase-like uncharacterized protein
MPKLCGAFLPEARKYSTSDSLKPLQIPQNGVYNPQPWKGGRTMPQQNNSPDENKKIVRRFVEECWNQGSLNKVSELLADQVRFHDPVFPNMNSGIQNIKNHIETSRKAFPDLKFTIDDTIAEGNEVVVHWTARGTHKGQFLGMPPTDRKVIIDGTSIYRLEGSKIAEAHANWNLATMMAQLGVFEVPKEARGEVKQEPSQAVKSRV